MAQSKPETCCALVFKVHPGRGKVTPHEFLAAVGPVLDGVALPCACPDHTYTRRVSTLNGPGFLDHEPGPGQVGSAAFCFTGSWERMCFDLSERYVLQFLKTTLEHVFPAGRDLDVEIQVGEEPHSHAPGEFSRTVIE